MRREWFLDGGGRGGEVGDKIKINYIQASPRGFSSLLSPCPPCPQMTAGWIQRSVNWPGMYWASALGLGETLTQNELFCGQGKKTITHKKAKWTEAIYGQWPQGVPEELIGVVHAPGKAKADESTPLYWVCDQVRKEDGAIAAVGRFRMQRKLTWNEV